MNAARKSKPRGNNRADGGRKRSGRSRNRKSAAKRRDEFWGSVERLPDDEYVVVTNNPAAVVRSLGRPPFAGPENLAEHYFDAVYERTVNLATALAAAGDLIAPDDGGS